MVGSEIVGNCPIIKSVIPFTNRTLKELIDLHPFMIPGNPGDPDRTIYGHITGLDGERFVETNILTPCTRLKYWRLDLTAYTAEDLATGELNRSKGHVNSQHQLEIAQVLSGQVRLLLQDPRDLSTAYFADAELRDCVLIPPGWYHSTHVLAGPAVVIDLVNREGFNEQKDKRYGYFQAAYTFGRKKNGEVTIEPNPQYSKQPLLLKIYPAILPVLRQFAGSIAAFFHEAPAETFNQLARDILLADISSDLVRPASVNGITAVSYLPLIA